jgi:hypothetical protein
VHRSTIKRPDTREQSNLSSQLAACKRGGVHTRGNAIELESRNSKNSLEIDKRTAVPDQDEGPLDYQMAMDVLIQCERPAEFDVILE